MPVNDLLPDLEMRVDGVLPFRRARIGYLWALGVAHAGMDLVCAADGELNVGALILEPRFMDHHPMGEVCCQA